MNILGLGGLLDDAACAVVREGELVAAVEQKKLARRSRAGDLPEDALRTALQLAGLRPEAISCVALVRPFSAGPESGVHLEIRERFPNARVAIVEHHLAHAASAYFASPFDEATVLTLDRRGDFRCGARWRAQGTTLTTDAELYAPDSLGDLYSRVTELLGFEMGADEHKVQWLSTAGDDSLVPLFTAMLGAREGWPRLDRSYFDENRLDNGGFSPRFFEEAGLDYRGVIPEAKRAALAAGVQRAVEQTAIAMAGRGSNLCIAGGLAMNALLVRTLESAGTFERVFAQPAAGNSGSSIGAALYAWHRVFGQTKRASLGNLCLGPAFSAEEIKQVLENCKLRFRLMLTTDEVIASAVEQLNDYKIVAWMQGRMEFGPRALGNRSILASPLNPYSTENLNVFIKRREPFRKFAASVPAEFASRYFEVGENARFLATVGRVREEHATTFASATLGRDLVRVHVVHAEDNPLYHRLLLAAGDATDLPVLYNTSFNLFGDPLVCTPRDAVRSFYSSGVDAMFVGNFLLTK